MPELITLNLTEAIAAERRRASRRGKPRAKKSARTVNTGMRMYSAARSSRLTEGWGVSNSSEDAELSASLRIMRSRSRQLVRDVPHALRAKRIIQNNVIGNGIGLQARVISTRGKLNERVNDEIEEKFKTWGKADSCHTGGLLCFADIERLIVGEVFEAGEMFVRKHYRKFGGSDVPLALELIEPERVIDEMMPAAYQNMQNIRMGVECDEFHRPMAYWIRKQHPGELRFTPFQPDLVERVPADQIFHMRLIDRWPQTRSIPWMHAVAGRLNDMGGYSEAEIIAARAAAAYMGIIETPDEVGEAVPDGSGRRELTIEPGIVERLNPGEKWNFAAPNRPNAAMDPFMRLMLREVAAGAGVSYESLSRDYSQSNYSSSRLALLDDRDSWKMLQLWFIRNFRELLQAEWMQLAVLSGAIESVDRIQYANDAAKFNTANFKARGWGWVDPTKEVEAYKEAVRGGLTTNTQVIAQSGDGRDYYEIITEREEELKLAKEKGLVFDTDPQFAGGKAADSNAPNPKAEDDTKPADTEEYPDDAKAGRVLSIQRG